MSFAVERDLHCCTTLGCEVFRGVDQPLLYLVDALFEGPLHGRLVIIVERLDGTLTALGDAFVCCCEVFADVVDGFVGSWN